MASALIVLRCASQPAAKMFCKSRVPRQVRARTAVGDKGGAAERGGAGADVAGEQYPALVGDG